MLDLLSLQLLLSIIAASGIIAYVADRLGKKLGKKRLSVRVGRFSLRPKHVATLGTVAMGLAVSVITIALVAAASKDARIWLREGRQLLIQREQYKKEIESLQLERGRLSKDTKELAKANGELGQTNLRLVKTNKGLREAIGELQKSLESERSHLAQAQAQRDGLVAEASRLQGKIRALGASRAATLLALKNSRAELAGRQIALRSLQAKLTGVQKQIIVSNAELKTSGLNLTDARNKLNEALVQKFDLYKDLQRLQGEVNAAKAQVTDLTAQREKAESDLAATQLQYRTTQARLDKATQNLIEVMTVAESQQGFLNSGFKSSRTEPLTFRAREEVGRIVVPGGADTAEVQAALTSLIRKARLDAADRGAKSHRTGGQTFEVADIFERQDPKTKTVISSEELKNAVIARAAGRVEDQVLVATSSFNAFAGEPVSLDISVLPNPVIYHQGEMLSEARIDGSLPEEEIFAQISEFLRSRVKERATEDRMIPKSGTDAPFGVVPSADMFALVRDVKRVGRPVRVQALAQDNIRAADPLRLEFRLK